MDTIYIEKPVIDHPRTLDILARFPDARLVEIERYTDVFNAPAQNFRVQKQNPALILARKHGKRVLPTPAEYHIGGKHNYYFSHMLNCVYDCRYCFLQGMYRSANYVLFVNFEDFFDDIANQQSSLDKPGWYFSGYDCDSLALEPLTGFMQQCLDAFEKMPGTNLEIRTKSTQIRELLSRSPLDNCVIAYSLSPDTIARAEEHKAASLEKRLSALQSLQSRGWKIGLRFDPLIMTPDYKRLYTELFEAVFSRLDSEDIHSVSMGMFRLPKAFHKKMFRLYPESKLLAANMVAQKDAPGMLSYGSNEEQQLMQFCEHELLNYIDNRQYFPCMSVS